MQFFIALYTNWAMDFEVIEKVVLEADRLGFDGVLMPDHYMYANEGLARIRPDRNGTLDVWMALAYLASRTKRVHLGTLVTPIPLRPPHLLAKMVSTLDVLSKGRVVLGVGAGWSQVEFEGYSEWDSPKVRVDKVQEGVELMIRLWTQDIVTFEGKYYKAKGAVLEPKSVQRPYPKLLFGGHKDRMLKLAGKYANIAYISTAERELEDAYAYFAGTKKKVLRAAKQFRRVNEIDFMFGGYTVKNLYKAYETEEYLGRVEAAATAGAKYFITPFPAGMHVEAMNQFAKEIMPSFS